MMYERETKIFFEDIRDDVKEKFDTSDFPKDHPSGIQGHSKKVIRIIKDEAAGMIIDEFVGLKAKLIEFQALRRKRE